MAKPKYDYRSEGFISDIESMAKKGLTDGEIAFSLGLSITEFSRKKNSIAQIAQALTRGRNTINAAVRQTYLSLALGKVKTKSITKKAIELPDGTISDKLFVLETETDVAPNANALATWLFNHDEEWRQKTIEGKKLDVTTNGKDIVTQLVFSSTPLSEKDMEEIKRIQNGDSTKKDSTDTSVSEA